MRFAELPVDRRTFLKAAGLTAGVAAASPLLRGLGGAIAQAQAAPATMDVTQLAADLAYDQEAIFRFVADQIGYDPYAGALRGAAGTLASRSGNAVDQALLLAALLDEALIPYRFVVGSLDATKADALAGLADVDVATARDRVAPTLLPPATLAAWSGTGAWTRAAEVDGLFVEARARVEASVQGLVDALGAASVELPAPAAALPDMERDRHVWIQVSNGPGWIDLDPTFPGTPSGTAIGTGGDPVDALPDDLYHRVVLIAEAETVQLGAPVRSEVLRHEARAVDVAGIPLTLIHPTPGWLGITQALTGQQQHAPTLIVGDALIQGTNITLGAGGGIDQAFGVEGTNEGQALAEWLTVQLLHPDGTTRSVERAVFDRVDPDVRAAGAVDPTRIEPVVLVDAGEGLGEVYLPLAGLLGLAVTAAPVPWTMFAAADGARPPDDLTLLKQAVHSFAHLRDLLRLEAQGDRSMPRFFQAEPAVTGFWSTPTGVSADGRRELAIAVDILHAQHAMVPFPDADVPVPAGLLAGAMDHAAERMVLEGTFSVMPDPPEQSSFLSAGRVFELAAERGTPLVVLKPGDTVTIPGISAPVAATIAAALTAGLVVVAPGAPVEIDGAPRLGWWEIDPVTGDAHDRMDTGGGATLGEYLEAIHELATWAMCIASLGAAIGAVCMGAVNGAMAWGAVAVGQCIAAVAGGTPGAHLGH